MARKIEEKKSMNRREFLKKSFLGGAAALLVAKGLVRENKDNEKINGIGEEGADVLDKKEIKEEFRLKIPEGGVSRESIKISNLIYKYYNILSREEEFFPPEIFTESFFIADQIQESGYRADAVSHSKAVGVMQTKEIVVRDVVESLALFKRKNPELFSDEIPKKVDAGVVEEVLELVKLNPDLGRALGKLYFAVLFNRYKVGKKEFEAGDREGVQKILLASYNFGPRAKKIPEHRWPRETKDYYKKVLDYKEKIDRYKDAGLSNHEAMLRVTGRKS